MYETSSCTRCHLHSKVKSVCLPGIGGDIYAKMAIYIDNPNFLEDKRGKSFVSDAASFVRFCLKRMRVSEEDVYLDYTVKCAYAKIPSKREDRQKLIDACDHYRFATLQSIQDLRSIVALGELSAQAFAGRGRLGTLVGADWTPCESAVASVVKKIWVGYSPGYALNSPAESAAIYRIIWKAAEEAGLNPTTTTLTPFPYEI
jgi:uracil-DNA glycosylase family 4